MLSHYTAKELAGMPGLPGTPNGVRIKALRESWRSQRRVGTKAMEYSFDTLPNDAKTALIEASINKAAPAPEPLVLSVMALHSATVLRVETLERLLLTACDEVLELKRLLGGCHA